MIEESNLTLLDRPPKEFWREIHRAANSLLVESCWTHCSSYCCKTNHPQQKFSLMKCDSAGMVFPMEEYRFLANSGLLQEGFASAARFHTFEFDSARALSLKFVTSTCSLGGICSLPDFRPLICKFYPLYPDPAANGEKIDLFVAGSIIDQYWEKLKIEHPCWLLRNKSQQLEEAIRTDVMAALGHPYLLFYLKAAAAFVREVTANAARLQAPAASDDPRQFFKQWEVSYLMGKLVDVPRFKRHLTELYDEIAQHFGPFEV